MANKTISAFEIIGPVMIGPSSSHTAGAARLALWARRIAGQAVVKANFILQGSFASTYEGHGTDRALLAGLLGYQMDDPKLRQARELAAAAGLRYSFVPDFETVPDHPNTILFDLTLQDGSKLHVTWF